MQNDKSNKGSIKFISKSFLDGDYEKFVSEYDIHFMRFIEWERLRDKIKEGDYDIINFEKEFIKKIGEYIYQKNLSILIKEEEEINKIKIDFLIENNISAEVLEDAILNSDNEESYKSFKERNVVLRDYFIFKIKKQYGKKIEPETKKIRASYNYKIHYLKYRANLIGFKSSFEKGVKFNDFETDQLLELHTHNKFSKPQKFIILKELGILDFLREKHSQLSQNGIAKILMDITGETNYQDKLNGHANQGANDPYNNEKNVEMIKQHLTINRNINFNS